MIRSAPRGQARTATLSGVTFGVLFGGTMVGVMALAGAPTEALVYLGGGIALFGGLAFGVGVGSFLRAQQRAFEASQPHYEALGLVHDGPASHLQGRVANGGWLWLTEDRLEFAPHGYNGTNAPWSVDRREIQSVEPGYSAGVIPNRITVHLRGGWTERFVVQDRSAWLDALP